MKLYLYICIYRIYIYIYCIEVSMFFLCAICQFISKGISDEDELCVGQCLIVRQM